MLTVSVSSRYFLKHTYLLIQELNRVEIQGQRGLNGLGTPLDKQLTRSGVRVPIADFGPGFCWQTVGVTTLRTPVSQQRAQ